VWSGGCRVDASLAGRECVEKSLVCSSVGVHAVRMHMQSRVGNPVGAGDHCGSGSCCEMVCGVWPNAIWCIGLQDLCWYSSRR
jgi:hypothetical protein